MRVSIDDIRLNVRAQLAEDFPEFGDEVRVNIIDGHACFVEEEPAPDYGAPWVHRPEEEEYARVPLTFL